MVAPSWVLLNRDIFFEHDASEAGGEPLIGGASGIARGVLPGPPGPQDARDAVLAYLRILKPEARLANPPELSSLRILRPTKSIPFLCGDITDAFIASADKNLVALYAGPYRPGSDLKGGYLIYDASKNSLSAIPQPPNDDYSRVDACHGAAVLCLEGGEYVLGELTKVACSDPPEAALCTWRSATAEWVVETASFPAELWPPTPSDVFQFQADACFSFGGSSLCWVDLFKGMVVCDLRAALPLGARPELRFVPLPGECPTYDRFQSQRKPSPEAEEFRSMAYVGGSIKFVTMDGYGERPGEEVSLVVWTLSPDLGSWKKGKVYHMRDIWASEAHLSLGLLPTLPSFPVLSMHEDDVVYLLLTDLHLGADRRVEYKGQYLIRVDMERNEVEYHPANAERIWSPLCAADFGA